MKEKCIDCKYSRQCVTVKQIDPECCLKDRNSEKKDEIKEILEYAKSKGYIDLDYEESKLLLDYITNLQEENKGLKEEIEILTLNDDNENVWLEDYNM